TQQAPSPATRVSPDGTFVLAGAIAGNYRVYAPPLLSPNNPGLLSGLPPAPPALGNSYIKSIRVGGADVLDSGVRLVPVEGLTMEVVIGSSAGILDGKVTRDGKPAADVTVGMLPNSASARGYRTDMHRTILTDASGHFQFRGLPPGDYKIFAWEDADKDAIMDLDFVRGYEEKGTRLEIADGEKKSIELNVIPARQQ
ncbi:MAG TPA: carboxypeptidase-like regulatory domain-containing protein, partial [Terriglobia bacterium]|nr:carboxypeptidase-like regulatory domain-containing protein [Terriglobia bacterium]